MRAGLLDILLIKENGIWVAQCLQFDITAQGKSIADAGRSFVRVFVAQILSDLEVGQEPLANVPKAPPEYWQMCGRIGERGR